MQEDLIFYKSKGRICIGIITLLAFVSLFISLTIIVYDTLTLFMIFLTITLILFYALIKNLISLIIPTPYIVLTEHGILLNPGSLDEVEIKWRDISGFRLDYILLRQHIHIGLYDETKYGFKKGAIHRGYTFSWKALSKEDRVRFAEGVNKRKSTYTNDLNKLLKQEKAIQKEKQKLNIYYFLRAYMISFMITAILWYIFDFFNHRIMYFLCFLFYPFAKIAYDKAFGFNLIYRLDKETRPGLIKSEVFIAPLIFWIVLYFLIPILAPFGFLYLLLSKPKEKSL